MTDLEKAVEALKLCIPPELYEKALVKVEKLHGGAKEAAPKRSAVEVITHLLLNMGIPQHIKGYRFTVTAIELILQDPNMLDGITKRLYPEIAKLHGSTPGRVERAIRHGIEVAWERGDRDVHYTYFRNTIDVERAKPTNSEFLARMAYAAQAELEK